LHICVAILVFDVTFVVSYGVGMTFKGFLIFLEIIGEIVLISVTDNFDYFYQEVVAYVILDKTFQDFQEITFIGTLG
jgi:tRNA G37 N-methylase Trm5